MLLAALSIGAVVLGCDQVSAPGEKRPPTVSQIAVSPDTFDAATLEPVPDRDSLVRDTVGISIRADDPDGEIERVTFIVEPASNPRGTVAGPMRRVNNDLYAGGAILTVPRYREATYTIRVYAVDQDSLASNQGVGRLQVIPES